ncbi:MAG: MoxR family ATPase [Candidatus Accumulibacter sp.]|jgi:MoxR-like ATPase|nr:MoxR family ATPase [Accumulibacter sp.]
MSTNAQFQAIHAIIAEANRIILGKDSQIRLALACLLARGHLLIEDIPGIGKTTLAHTLAQLLGLNFSRIQFTSDMLPADIIGISIFERDRGDFRFLPGALFTQVLLADEINRATPKTQSALLEAMEERQVTVEGQTRPLPEPFFVIATQNPSSQIGTFPLPESQLDRFLMRIEIGYPDRNAERVLLESGGRRDRSKKIETDFTPERLKHIQQSISGIRVSPPLLDYLQNLIDLTRHRANFMYGLSPRAALGLLSVARAWAFIAGREMVLPEDIQAVFPSIAGHRLRLSGSGEYARFDDIDALIRRVPVV